MMVATAAGEYRRRVAFGECDSARIFFTPRAVEYAVEAVELWYEDVLGVSWADLLHRDGLEASFVRGGCEYFRPLVADQSVRLAVRVIGSDPTGVTFRVTARDESATDCFRATLVAEFRDRRHGAPAPIPDRYRERIDAFRSLFPEEELPEKRSSRAPVAGIPERNGRLEGAAGTAPYLRQRRVAYGECSPGGTLYVPKIVTYAVEAVGEWYRDTLGISWQQQCISLRGIPFIEIRFDVTRHLTPGETLCQTVTIPHLGRSGIGYEVTGCDAAGEPCFNVEMSACYITEETENGRYRPIPFPDEMRGRILAYQAACAVVPL